MSTNVSNRVSIATYARAEEGVCVCSMLLRSVVNGMTGSVAADIVG